MPRTTGTGRSCSSRAKKGYYVPGEAWGAVRYKDYALLKGYRQQVDQGYINPQDNRMTPNTFEAVTLGGKVGWLQYLAGYLWNIKTRNSDEFVAMSSAAGVKGQHDGVGLAGVRLTPREDLKIDVSNQYGIDMFNTLYAEATYLHRLTEDWQLRVGPRSPTSAPSATRTSPEQSTSSGPPRRAGHACRRSSGSSR